MRQEVDTLERLAVDYVLDGDLRLRQVQRDLAAAEAAHDGAAQARLHSELDTSTLPCDPARRRKVDPGDAFPREAVLDRVFKPK